ncbi:hypothetical protein AZI87_14685 [Bdellovibrio bacteriovorus]|uniref:HD/PDEase domain-containing protein n=1 Tax=Bdellovibrio bacteriovorus TaxID=959 RepID=A0A162FVF7_BDEBC|nr:HD domain-containing protein [Bdellovibrio bacteriovorus]KYG62548.1 hypothetical protein AZI87_14685 [Bdellovibrio bacteriovorus]
MIEVQLLKAVEFAAEAHVGHKRKSSDEPYINHLIRVAHQAAKAGLSLEAVEASLLHDILEDTSVTAEDLEQAFSKRVVDLVELMTQWWPDDAPQNLKRTEIPKYYAAILKDPEAIAIKLLDRADNLREMARTIDIVPRWAQRYLKKSEMEMEELLNQSQHLFAVEDCRRALEELRRALMKHKPSRSLDV